MSTKKFTSKVKSSKVSNFLVEYLIVGGGGGSAEATGCCTGSAGGGAGGMREGTFEPQRGISYSVTVGAGGTGNLGTGSSIFGIAASGGGRGTSWNSSFGNDGGSGGGGGYATFTASSGIPGQGNNGGTDLNNTPNPGGGGGGGAGAVGSNGSVSNGSLQGGNGGIGKQSSITGTATYYAGGGGASIRGNYDGSLGTSYPGTGGSGGGGTGSSRSANDGTNGTANTGGGSGGSYGQAPGSSNRIGGSGVVIVRTGFAAASTTGSPTYTTSGGWHIYKFTGDGSITY